MSDDKIIDFPMSANQIYDIIMEEINTAEIMMIRTDHVSWYIRRLAYEDILYDLLLPYIIDPDLPYFKEPEVTELDE